MLVEHTFVTTQPLSSVVTETEEVLRLAGYRVDWLCLACGRESVLSAPHCGSCGEERGTLAATLVGKRGMEHAAKARRTIDLPQRAQVQYERGRINIAASIMEKRKVELVHRQLMLALVRLLEEALVSGPTEVGLSEWRDACETAERFDVDEQKKRRKGCLIAFLLVAALFAAMIALIVLAGP